MDAFAPGAAVHNARLEKNVRGASSPLLAALERAKIALGAAETAYNHVRDILGRQPSRHGDPEAFGVAAEAAGIRLLGRAEDAHAAALAACYEAGVLALPVAAVEDAEAALAFALDEVAKRSTAKPNAMPGGRP